MTLKTTEQVTPDLESVSEEHLFRPLATVASGLVFIFTLAIFVNLTEGLPEQAVVPLVVFDALLALAFLGLRVALWQQIIPARSAHLIAGAMATLVLGNVILAFALVGDPFYLYYAGLIVLGCGAFLLSIPWMLGVTAGVNVAWMAVSLFVLPVQDFLHYGLSVWAASVLGIVIFIARRRVILRSEQALQEARREASLREQAEAAAEKLGERLSLAISASQGGYWHISFDSENPEMIPDEIELDPALKAFIGFEDHEMPNSRAAWKARVLPEDREATEQASLAHFRGDTPLHEARYRIRHKDGSIRWIYSCGRVERDPAGRPVGASGISWDITDRVEAESRLHRLSQAVEQSSSLLIITDTEGKIEYVNPRFTHTTGYTLEEVVGKTPAILKSEHASDKLIDEMWKTIRAGKDWQGEFQNVKKNGEPYWVIASISPVRDAEGNVTHFVGVQEDITERRRVESQLFQAQKMEGIGQLVSGVAHDFNNLLTGIVGFSDLSLAMVEPDSPLRVNLEQISKAGESAMALTRQLLTFSRQQPRPPRIIDLNEVIRGFEKLLRRTISEDIVLATSLAPTPEPVNADPSQVEQILVNLAINARDAMPEGGKVTIETTEKDLAETKLSDELELAAGRYVVLSVSDTGHGMDEATSSRMFEPFFTTKERGRGTGLGLSTVYGIVKQSCGHIEVESEPGEGTTIRILLPRAEEAADAGAHSGPHGKAVGGSERILLVEDDELVREFAVRLLRQNGYEVWYAESARKALKKWSGEEFDLLVTDVVMPGMSGVELAERLTDSLPEMKVLFLSGYADREIIENRILESDATFLAKPFAVDEFVQTVRDLLDSQSAIQR